ncbi:UNVERIFIED_CONTAM: hypothetical protein FKN15_056597 [Acipenser sinensis]
MVQHRALPCTALLVAYSSHSSLGIHPGCVDFTRLRLGACQSAPSVFRCSMRQCLAPQHVNNTCTRCFGAPVLYSTSLSVLGVSTPLVPECFNTRLSCMRRWEPLARQQAQALAVAPAQSITPAPELTPPAPVVAPDVTRWHLPC